MRKTTVLLFFSTAAAALVALIVWRGGIATLDKVPTAPRSGSTTTHREQALATVRITDQTGRTVEIPARVERAVVLMSEVCEVIYALGEWEKVVGISRYCPRNPTLRELVPDIADLPAPGSGWEVNLERLIALKPDVVILWVSTSSPSPVVQQLQERGIPVVAVRCMNFVDIYGMIKLTGRIFGKDDKAQALISRMKEVVTLVRQRVKQVPQTDRPRVIWTWTQQTRVTGGVGLTSEMIGLAGGTNPAAKFNAPYATVSVEQIIAWDPQAIIIWESARYSEQDILDDPAWRSTSAVKARMVRKNSELGGLWAPETAIKLLAIAKWLHPEKFKDIDIDAVAEKFYADCYGVSFRKLFR